MRWMAYKPCISHGPAGWKTKMRLAASSGSDEDPLCRVDDLLFPDKKRARESFGGLFYKDNNLTYEIPSWS